jgi:hypothetical protein
MTAKQILTKAGLEGRYWGKKIIAAEAQKGFTDANIIKAWRWTTCACGKLNDGIPRSYGPSGWPLDDDLFDLGVDFSSAVANNHFLDSAKTLIKIEKRAKSILEKRAKSILELLKKPEDSPTLNRRSHGVSERRSRKPKRDSTKVQAPVG